MRRFLLSLALLPLLGAACGSTPPPAPSTTAQTPPTDEVAAAIEADGLEDAAFVSIGPTGFSPAAITVKKGESVTWLNEDAGGSHWPASGDHPTHREYPGFDPKAPLPPGGSWSFRFDTIGTWDYHDHLHARMGGTVTVTE